jgi:periplasmic copper chaperone A
MSRMPWSAALAGVAMVALGAAGLIRGAVPQSVAASGSSPSTSPPIVVTAAYVVPPVPPTQVAAAYFTVYNTTAKPDTLESVQTGAGASAVLHVYVDGQMTVPSGGIVVPAHGKLVLTTGAQHVMIEQLFGPLTPGQNIPIELVFADAGPVNVSAPVIALGAAPPTGSASVAPTGAAPTTGGSK